MKRLVLVTALLACAGGQKPATVAAAQPPVAARVPHPVELHGETLQDDYAWLREKGTPQVVQYLRAEAAYADAMMQPTRGLQQTLYAEMLSRVQETDVDAPFLKDGSWYYTRTEKGKQYPVLCRRKGSPQAPEEVLLDLNQLAEGKKFIALGAWEVSDDGNLLAYTTDDTGFRQYALHVRDLRTMKDLADKAARVDSIAWARGGEQLFYVVEDPVAKRPWQLYRHALAGAKDELVLEEKDEKFDLYVQRSRSRDFIFVTAASHTTSEVRFFGASDPFATPVLVQPREPGHEYYVDHRGGLLYIRTNSGGRNFRLVTAPVWAPRKENWKEIVPHREEVMLREVDLFANHLVRTEREGGLPQIVITDLRTGAERKLSYAEADYDVGLDHNEEWDTNSLRIAYQSLVTPKSVYDVDLASGEWKLVKRDPVPNYDASKYAVERIWASASDGTRVPVALVHGKGAARDGRSALFLYAYGSYGVAYPDWFDSRRFSLVDRGVTYAIAHIRGGGEMGKKWHDQGRMMNKMNTFTDFIACAEQLIAQGYTVEGPARHRRRQRRRAADGRGDESAARPLPRGGGMGAVRGRAQHHARRVAAAHRGRVRGVGQSQARRRIPLHAAVFALRQRGEEGVSGHAGEVVLQRLAGDVLGAGQMGGPAAREQDRPEPAALQDRHGARRPRRPLRPLRPPAGIGLRLRFFALAAGRGRRSVNPTEDRLHQAPHPPDAARRRHRSFKCARDDRRWGRHGHPAVSGTRASPPWEPQDRAESETTRRAPECAPRRRSARPFGPPFEPDEPSAAADASEPTHRTLRFTLQMCSVSSGCVHRQSV